MLAPGSTLGHRYTLGRLIAAGGMGDVWEATDDVLRRPVAVKVMRLHGPDDSFLERFRDEARGSAGLHHPNIASVFDYGEEDGTAYLVMELVPGRTLSELIRESDGMRPDDVRSIMSQAALALAAAHESGVVHRDVKPANIIVTPTGQVKLTDFGIARLGDGSGHTVTGEVLGTPHYISPEQALGKPATPASDVYALGIVAHEMLTGRRPFDEGMPVATALAQVHDAPPPLPATVPADLRAVVESCLAKEPGDRPVDARAVAAAVTQTGADAVGVPDGGSDGGADDTAYVAPSVSDTMPTASGTTPLAAVDPTRAMPVQTRRADVLGTDRRAQATERRVSRQWAWLAIPAVALIAWGAFALGGLVNRTSTATSTGTPPGSAPGAPGASTTVSTTTGSPRSTTTTPRTTTTTTEPTSTTTSTSLDPSHPGKGKGKGREK